MTDPIPLPPADHWPYCYPGDRPMGIGDRLAMDAGRWDRRCWMIAIIAVGLICCLVSMIRLITGQIVGLVIGWLPTRRRRRQGRWSQPELVGGAGIA